jgi:hypothetical protein
MNYAQTVPTPSHVIVVIDENHAYNEVIGSSFCPYINSLLGDSNTALFDSSFGLTHPSQPNYLLFYSGSNQGVTTDGISSSTPFTTCNLGASIIAAGKTFTGYCEDLPSVGSLSTTSGNYARKHNPWSNWQGTGTNSIPKASNQPLTALPTSKNYSKLPTLTYIIPNLADDMHNPSSITTSASNGDVWFKAHIDTLIQWVKKNNSLLIFTFDEDDGFNGNQITTIFIGQMVKGGTYHENISHYNILRTIEKMYGLSSCSAEGSVNPITDCWRSVTTSVNDITSATNDISVWPVPAKDNLNIKISSQTLDKGTITLVDITGREISKENVSIKSGENTYSLNTQGISNGIYFVKITSDAGISFCTKVVVTK